MVGASTIGSMLRHRSEQEFLLDQYDWDGLYGQNPMDRTHEKFTNFTSKLGSQLSEDRSVGECGRTIGLFYSGEFDSAFAVIQRPALRGTILGRSYQSFADRIKQKFPDDLNFALLLGNWNPQGENRLFGHHPDVGVQLGWEGRKFRADGTISYRFQSSDNPYTVDSLGNWVATTKFNSWLFGVDCGLKIFDTRTLSTDIFGGFAYDVVYSVTKATDPVEHVSHGSAGASIGLRQRIFVNARTGMYIGAMIRYSVVDYSNSGGTDISGNTVTVSAVIGWSVNETLQQFLKKLNYKGNWRKR
jgi:hypothetical protein